MYVQCETCDEHMVETVGWFDADRSCGIGFGILFNHCEPEKRISKECICDEMFASPTYIHGSLKVTLSEGYMLYTFITILDG